MIFKHWIDRPDGDCDKDGKIKDLEQASKSVYTKSCQAELQVSDDLAQIVNLWPNLPEHIKLAMMALAGTQ